MLSTIWVIRFEFLPVLEDCVRPELSLWCKPGATEWGTANGYTGS